MDHIKVLIVEDEALYADKLEMLLDKLGYEHAGTVDNSKEALSSVATLKPDFILMDVNIQGDYDGIELSEKIQELRPTPIIFITSMADDMTFKRIKRTKAYGYLLKPFNELQLQRSLELTVDKLSEESENTDSQEETVFNEGTFWVKDKSVFKKINCSDVVYIEAEGKYCTLFTKSSRIVIRSSMVKLLDKLSAHGFVQSQKAYCVNLKHIESLDANLGVIYAAGFEVPLSRRSKDHIMERLDFL